MHRSRSTLLEGGNLLIILALGLTAAAGAAYLAAPDAVEGARAAIRLTARTSLALFLLAFTAAAWVALAPGRPTRWIRRNRRYFGLGFAVSHLLHLTAIVALARLDPVLFGTLTNAVTLTSGSIAYAFILAMAATSFDRAVVWLGPARWRLMHTLGAWYVWVSFMVAFSKRIPADAAYGVGTALLLGALAVKLIAWRRAKRQARSLARA